MNKFVKQAIVSIVIVLLVAASPSVHCANLTDLPSKGASGAKLNLVLFSEFH